ncbi:MAG TPA: hypothetical protein VGD68_09160, partial [Streptosporangiaceae bacterium]
ARRRPALPGRLRPLARQFAAAARPALGGLTFWAFPAWGTSPYWETIPYGQTIATHAHAHAAPPAR